MKYLIISKDMTYVVAVDGDTSDATSGESSAYIMPSQVEAPKYSDVASKLMVCSIR